MLTTEKITKQFEVLEIEANELLRAYEQNGYKSMSASFYRWHTQTSNLIERVCGKDSAHMRAVCSADRDTFDAGIRYHSGILQAAHRDFVNGFLSNLRHVIHAEIADDFLSQSEALLAQGYHVAAVSLAGALLEDTLRHLCIKHSVAYNPSKTSIEALNMDLARAGVYDRLVQKRITAESDLRNSADHGRFDNVRKKDAEDMVHFVRRFVSERLP
jgi:uncharacterized protein (UPF0332 family)